MHLPIAAGVRIVLILACLLGAARGAAAAPWYDFWSSTDDARDVEGFDYVLALTGVADDDLESLLLRASLLETLREKPPETHNRLIARAREDEGRLKAVMESRGYYDAEVGFSIDDAADPAAVTLAVTPNRAYELAGYSVAFAGTSRPKTNTLPSYKDMNIRIGMVAEAEPLNAAQDILVRSYRERGWPHFALKDRQAAIDRAAKTVAMVVTFDAGRPANFGDLRFAGLKTVSDAYLRRFVPWKQGDFYDIRKIEQYRRDLIATGLFATAAVLADKQVRADGAVTIEVTVTEGAHRTVGTGFGYSTADGPGAKVFWETINLSGGNETFRATASASPVKQAIDLQYAKPEFLLHNQHLAAGTELRHVENETYSEYGFAAQVGLERRFPPHWRSSIFVTGEYGYIEDDTGTHHAKLLGLPMEVSIDTSDNLFDPTRGLRLTATVTPYVGHTDQLLTFLSNKVSGAVYLPLDAEGRTVFALRGQIGSLIGADRFDIPASKRFYAGGGGSVRGYEFQSLGPLDAQNDPEGGRSVYGLGAEVRLRVGDAFGIVPFVEAGNVSAGPFPDFSVTPQWSAGLGLRYFTAIGPVRLDIAVPMNGRSGIDDDFQIYASLGQAF